MKIGSFEFNLREFAGSLGDLGTLFPLAVGYIAVCGMDPTGMLVMMGAANIATGLIYKLPMPIEPMKVLAVMAIAQQWRPSLIYASGFAMGIVWLLMYLTGAIKLVARYTPREVIRGIQVSLGLLLAMEALGMVATELFLAVLSVVIIVFLRDSRRAPASIVLVALGVLLVFLREGSAALPAISISLPSIERFTFGEVWESLVLAGFAQVPLTATNAVIATSALISHYWPDKRVPESKLALNMGIMNLIMPFFGGMPLCHGAGGLAGQYFFGARTGGTNILEGIWEISLGLFFGASIATIFGAFPQAITGAMLLLVGLELIRFAKDLPMEARSLSAAVTVLVSVFSNMAFGYAAGMAFHYICFSRKGGAHAA